MGFAIPIDSVRGLVDQILRYGRVVRPTIGITIAPPQVLRQIDQEGVLILEVPEKTPAARAGLKGTYRYAAIADLPANVQSLHHLCSNLTLSF